MGFGNYAKIFKDVVFWKSFLNTTIYTLGVTPSIFIVAFILALMLEKPFRGVGFFRTLYFTPVIISFVASSLMWKWMYNDMFGIFNYLLMKLGLISKPIVWLGSASSAMGSVILMVTWKTAGFSMVILLAGLISIPEEIYEASIIDGAGRWEKIRYITLPLIKSYFFMALLISVLGSYLAFDQFYVMTQGGPLHGTETIVMWIYTNSFSYYKLGYGAAMSVMLLLFLMGFSYVYVRRFRTE